MLDLPELPARLRAFGEKRDELRRAARAGAQRRLEELTSGVAGLSVRAGIREGRPALEIVAVADEVGADLVVVGEQGPTRGIGALSGGTAERVLLRSHVPVLNVVDRTLLFDELSELQTGEEFGRLKRVETAATDRRPTEAVRAAALHDEEALIRGYAAWPLGRIGTAEAIAALRGREGVEEDG